MPVRLNDDALGGQYVKVRGVWDGTSIEAREITPVDEPPPEPLPRIACRAPADGWPGQPGAMMGSRWFELLKQSCCVTRPSMSVCGRVSPTREARLATCACSSSALSGASTQQPMN